MTNDTTEIAFMFGFRKEAVEKAIELVRQNGRRAMLVVCRDIPGNHTGGEECFCDPKIIIVSPEDLD
jgi:hypothetical protein